MTDRADLEHVAERSNNKNALKRARTILRDMDEHAARDMAAAAASLDEAHEAADAVDLARQLARGEDERREADEQAHAAAEIEANRARQRAERLAAEQTAAQEAAAEQSRKGAERRLDRLVELIAEIEAAAADEDLASANRRHMVAQREWHDLMSSMEAPDETLTQRFTAAAARLTSRVQEAQEADRHARRGALVNLRQLLERVEALAAKDDLPSKAAERALRDVRGALGHVPPLPSKQDYDEVTRRLKAAQAVLTPKLQALREIEGWQRWANVGIQEQLCEKMEALKSEEPSPWIRDLSSSGVGGRRAAR